MGLNIFIIIKLWLIETIGKDLILSIINTLKHNVYVVIKKVFRVQLLECLCVNTR